MSGSDPARDVGWVGLGAIGLPMAIRAAARGWRVHAYDPAPERCDAARAEGVEIMPDVAEVGRRADSLVVCVVRSRDQVQDSLLGADGALRAAPGRIGIVMSSIGATEMSSLAEVAARLDARLLDAPILGNAASAADGSMTVVVSGADPDFARASPLLTDLAAQTPHLSSELGAAQATKVVSQLLQIVGMLATLEGVALAERHHVSERDLLAVLDAYAPSWTTANWDYARDLWSRRDPASSLSLFAKDLAAASSDARAAGVDSALADTAHRMIAERLSAAPPD